MNSAARSEELARALEGMLGQIVGLERRPYAYGSSFALEVINVRLADGACLEILFKDLSRHALLDDARQAKPGFLYDPLREIDCYQSVLASSPMGTAKCYGAVVDQTIGRYWLFLEKVSGKELYQVGDIRLWQETARWLANFHQRFGAEEVRKLKQTGRWLTHDGEYYRLWPERAAAMARDAGARREIERLATAYETAVQQLVSLPVTFIHGEFYPSNILLNDDNAGTVRVCPVDWEMAAIAPGLIDLAALTAGNWPDNHREALALAYYDALPTRDRPRDRDFLTDLEFCRLHLCLQWLGWSAEWQPPTEHAKDWLGEARQLARKLGLLGAHACGS